MKALRIHEYGGVDVIKTDELPTPTPGPHEVLVEVKAAGVNFMDTQIRNGLFKKELPTTLGIDGAGVIKALGAEVKGAAVGDRVAWIFASGSYASHAVVPMRWLAPIPDALSFEDAAAVMFQGLTAHYLARSTYPLKPGDVCLIHSAAGGCGLLLCQIAKICGARVIGGLDSSQGRDGAVRRRRRGDRL
jgi:NADPH2:quinone reductase